MLYTSKANRFDIGNYLHKFYQEYEDDLNTLLDRVWLDESLYFKAKGLYQLLYPYMAFNIATLIYIDSLWTGKTLSQYKVELSLDELNKKFLCHKVNLYKILNLFNFAVDSIELEVSGASIEGDFVIEELITEPNEVISIDVLIENFNTIYKITNECN